MSDHPRTEQPFYFGIRGYMDKPPFEFNFAYEASDGAASGGLEMDCFILEIECASGDLYELTVWTEAYLACVREQDRETGTHLGGQYLTPPDLIVARHDVDLIARIVADLIGINGLREAWHIPDELAACWLESDPVPDDRTSSTILAGHAGAGDGLRLYERAED